MLNMIANAVKIWGSSFGAARTLSRPGTIIKSKPNHRGTVDRTIPTSPGFQTQIPRLPMARSPMARSSMPRTPSPVFMQSKEKKGFYPDVKEEEIDLETIDYDPEAVKSGVARRPMLLTHSFMMGLVVILLFSVMAVIVGMVNIGNLPQIDYMLTIVIACDRNQI
jgi:hypothetical protein